MTAYGAVQMSKAARRLWVIHPEWMDRAACREVDPELFFPERQTPADFAPALSICANCPVSVQCRTWGREEQWGVWGGVAKIFKYHHGDD